MSFVIDDTKIYCLPSNNSPILCSWVVKSDAQLLLYAYISCNGIIKGPLGDGRPPIKKIFLKKRLTGSWPIWLWTDRPTQGYTDSSFWPEFVIPNVFYFLHVRSLTWWYHAPCLFVCRTLFLLLIKSTQIVASKLLFWFWYQTNRLAAGDSPQTPWGELTVLPQTH